jgi:hypothetical protein
VKQEAAGGYGGAVQHELIFCPALSLSDGVACRGLRKLGDEAN